MTDPEPDEMSERAEPTRVYESTSHAVYARPRMDCERYETSEIVEWYEPETRMDRPFVRWAFIIAAVCAVAHFASLGFAIAFGVGCGIALPIVLWLRG